jgi:hypothetical protein
MKLKNKIDEYIYIYIYIYIYKINIDLGSNFIPET